MGIRSNFVIWANFASGKGSYSSGELRSVIMYPA